MYKIFKKLVSLILVLAMIFSNGISGISSYANVDKSYVDELLDKMKAPYDIMIELDYQGEDRESLTRQEKANLAQKDLIDLLEKEKALNNVEKYESFYIVNSIHAIIKSRDLVKQISTFNNVVRISANSKIHLINPIKEKKIQTFSDIFVPDEKRIEWGVSLVHADKVWDEYGFKGEGVTVGIIDTGVNYRLPAIKNSYKGYDAKTGKFDNSYYKDCIDGYLEPLEDHVNDHGTHVAGTICGSEGNINRIGVAPNVKFISARALNDQGGDVSNLMEAAQWMLEQKPDVINNSWGGSSDDDAWFEKIATAWKEAGIVGVFAAGNQGPFEDTPGLGSVANPGNMLNVLTVGAVDINKKLGSFSKKGPSVFDKTGKIIKPEIVAPGVQVRSIDALGNYVSWNGTSMATPHVVGVIALIKQADPSLSVDEIIDLIKDSCEGLNDNKYPEIPNMAYGYGLINAYDAIAKIKGRNLGSIYGKILKAGSDTEAAAASIISENDAYIGRDYIISAKLKDDISIKEAKAYYKFNDEADEEGLDLRLDSGLQNDGIYKGIIQADKLKKGDLKLRLEIKDYADNITKIEKTVKVYDGIQLPWSFDFENDLSGFISTGGFKLSKRLSQGEPPLLEGSTQYIGVDGGMPVFKQQTDSYLYLPPIDLKNVNEDDNLTLSADIYNGFKGVCLSKLEAKFSDENDWKLVHQTFIRPDFTLEERKWQHDTYSLKDFAKKKSDKPLLVRFYFFGRDKGPGLYIDNINISTNETTKPKAISDLKAILDVNAVKLSFTKNEETDIDEYIIERKTKDGDYTKIASIKQGENENFVSKNENNHSHFVINYSDEDINVGNEYTYRVKIKDISGNISEDSNEFKISYNGEYRINVIYDFEDNDGNFTTGILSGDTNDWEYGKSNLPKEWKDGTINHKNIYGELIKNQTNLWGTKLDGAMTNGINANEDAYLQMPEFEVKEGDYFYFDSFACEKYISKVTFKVEIKEHDKDDWQELISKEKLMLDFKNNQFPEWRTIGASLKEYENKKVDIRFRVISKGGIYSDYNAGWYIDNIVVGEKKKNISSYAMDIFSDDTELVTYNDIEEEVKNNNSDLEQEALKDYTTFGVSGGSIDESQAIPLQARVEVLETGKYTYAGIVDGSYKLKHAINLENHPYTLAISAYGYETQIVKVDLSKENNKELNFLLKPAKKSSIQGKVKDSDNNAIMAANISLVDDDNIEKIQTDGSGSFKLDNIYTGTHRIKIFKEGYIPKIIDKQLDDNILDLGDINLEKLPNLKEIESDYGFNVAANEDGKYQTVHFRTSMKGSAMRFQAPYEGSILKSASFFFVNNEYYSGKHIKIAVLAYDNEKRLREIVPFKEYKNIKPNEWNEINLEEYYIKKDEPIYIATSYDTELADSMGVYYDVKASDKAKARSYIYDGSFISTQRLAGAGAFAIKTKWLYKDGAKENIEAKLDDTSNNNGGEIRPLTETDFEFDKDSQTIIKYNGNDPIVSIPLKIKGIEVKHIAAHAFDKKGKDYIEKLERLIIPEGIETIGDGAFANNKLSNVVLPESLTEIGKDAFKNQFKRADNGSREFKINIPANIEIIKEGTFESAGSPLIVTGAKNLKAIENGAFLGNKKIEINAPKLENIAERAFGNTGLEGFEYAKIYTSLDTALKSKEGEYLINPALVTINYIDAKDDENILKIGLKYGPQNPSSYARNNKADAYYTIGQRVEIKPTDIKKNDITYTCMDKPVTLTLEKDNKIDFKYYLLEPQLRLPILDVDKEILGFSTPNSKIDILIDDKNYEATTNEDGLFKISVDNLKKDDNIFIKVNSKDAAKFIVQEYKNEEYIQKGEKLLRYMGTKKDVTIPVSIGNATDITQIGDFAFYNKNIESVVIPTKVSVIGAGAFLNNSLNKFAFNLDNINLSALRIIKEYAFKDNKIKEINALPELTHVIQTKAFENNNIEKLVLSKYMGHIGKAAFKNNKLKEINLVGNLEDLGDEAFMNNEISKISFSEPINASDHMEGINSIGAGVFAGNNISYIKLPERIKTVDETAFENNKASNLIIETDSAEIVPTANFDVKRSDGRILSLRTFPSQSGGGSRTFAGLGNRIKNNKYLPKNYEGKSRDLYNTIVPIQVQRDLWQYDRKTDKWKLFDENGNIYKNTWVLVYSQNADKNILPLPYAWYSFDEAGNMMTAWLNKNNAWYYLNTNKGKYEGCLLTGWQQIDAKWYYFETEFGKDMGKMYEDRRTPDGYYVDKNGVWDGKNKQ